MKLNTEQKTMEFGFKIHEPGKYLFQVAQGIKLSESEMNKSKSLMIPFTSVEAIDGNKDAVGGSANYFFGLLDEDGNERDFVVENLETFIANVGAAEGLIEKFPGEIDPTDPKFIGELQLRLPGTYIVGTIVHNPDKNNKDKVYANFKTLDPAKGAGKSSGGITAEMAKEVIKKW